MQLKYKDIVLEGNIEEILLAVRELNKTPKIKNRTDKECVVCKTSLVNLPHKQKLCLNPKCKKEQQKKYWRKNYLKKHKKVKSASRIESSKKAWITRRSNLEKRNGMVQIPLFPNPDNEKMSNL